MPLFLITQKEWVWIKLNVFKKHDSGFKSTVAPVWILQLFEKFYEIFLLSKSNLRFNDAVKLRCSQRNQNNNSKNLAIVEYNLTKIFWSIRFDCAEQWQTTEVIRNHVLVSGWMLESVKAILCCLRFTTPSWVSLNWSRCNYPNFYFSWGSH